MPDDTPTVAERLADAAASMAGLLALVVAHTDGDPENPTPYQALRRHDERAVAGENGGPRRAAMMVTVCLRPADAPRLPVSLLTDLLDELARLTPGPQSRGRLAAYGEATWLNGRACRRLRHELAGVTLGPADPPRGDAGDVAADWGPRADVRPFEAERAALAALNGHVPRVARFLLDLYPEAAWLLGPVLDAADAGWGASPAGGTDDAGAAADVGPAMLTDTQALVLRELATRPADTLKEMYRRATGEAMKGGGFQRTIKPLREHGLIVPPVGGRKGPYRITHKGRRALAAGVLDAGDVPANP